MLNLLARRVRGLAASSVSSSSSSTATTTTCARCRVHHAHAPPLRSAAASIHTSQSAQWLSRDERSDALHSRDADDDNLHSDRTSRRPPRFEEDTRSPARRYRRKETPRSFEQTTPSKSRMQRGRPDASYPPSEHDYPPENDGYAHEEYTPRQERPSKNPYKQQLQREKPPVRAFEQAQPPRRKYQEGTTKEEITKVETKDKIKAAIDAAKDLPPLTDEDYHEIYQELLTYDPPPPSPTQTRLALAAASSSHSPPLLLGNASQPARDRISELLTRLQKRVPAMEIPLASEEQSEETLSEKLQKLRTPAASSEVRDGHASDLNTLSNLLGENTPSTSAVTSSSSSSADIQGTKRPREHTRTRGTIFHALSVLLRPTPGVKDDSSEKKLIIGEQPIGGDSTAVRAHSNLATKQEWAALLLESANDLNLADVLTTLELMKRAGVAVSEDQLAATIRLLTKDQKLVHVFLRFFEQNEIALPLSAHHEIVLGILRSLEADALPTRAERYLRALEVAGTPALSITYAAVISHIFHSRRETGIRARAWNLFGHMRLVAHPTPSTEVYDAMIYGCSLDDRVSPERALDLFNEMLEAGIRPSYNTYLGLIRSCARDKTKDSPFYFESLRLLKELLERGFQPERDIFNCILEGARSRGDLARAKWIVANMVQIASRQSNPAESPLSPDGKIIQNLFLTAATFKIHDGASNKVKKSLLQDADTIPESVKAPDGELKQGVFLEADEAEDVKEDSPPAEDREAAFEEGDQAGTHSHIPALHPLFRLEVPSSNEQLLEDCKVILGSILEVHGLPTGMLESKMSGTEESGVLGNHDARQMTTIASIERDYCQGLDDNVKAALLNVPIGNAVLNAYLTLLSSHDTSHNVYSFFRQGFSSLGVKYSYQSWEIIFGTLDASTKQKDQAVREWKCTISDELFNEWQGWIEHILRNARKPPAWMYRHIETVYARHMGVHARARQMDQAIDIIRDFVARFPPENITAAVRSSSSMQNAGPDYLVKLSSALYPETMDTSFGGGEHSAKYSSSSNRKNIAIPRKSIPKSGLNSFNYFGIPPMLTYQMVYSTFHRFREEEDSRAGEILKLLHGYRMALDEAREIKKKAEIVSYKRGERAARREIIGLPGDKRERITVPKVSEALEEPIQRSADSLPDIEDEKL